MESISQILQDVRDYWADHFSRRFLPRRPTLRQPTSLSTFYLLDYKTRQAELGMDYGPPCAHLSKAKFVFQDGEWQCDGVPQGMPLLQLYSPDKNSPQKGLKKANKALLEENNYLKLQLELLMDMLTETTARLHLVEKRLGTTSWHPKIKKTNKYDSIVLMKVSSLLPPDSHLKQLYDDPFLVLTSETWRTSGLVFICQIKDENILGFFQKVRVEDEN